MEEIKLLTLTLAKHIFITRTIVAFVPRNTISETILNYDPHIPYSFFLRHINIQKIFNKQWCIRKEKPHPIHF